MPPKKTCPRCGNKSHKGYACASETSSAAATPVASSSSLPAPTGGATIRVAAWNVQGKTGIADLYTFCKVQSWDVLIVLEPNFYLSAKEKRERAGKLVTEKLEKDFILRIYDTNGEKLCVLYNPARVAIPIQDPFAVKNHGLERYAIALDITPTGSADTYTIVSTHSPFKNNDGTAVTYLNELLKQAATMGAHIVMGDVNTYGDPNEEKAARKSQRSINHAKYLPCPLPATGRSGSHLDKVFYSTLSFPSAPYAGMVPYAALGIPPLAATSAAIATTLSLPPAPPPPPTATSTAAAMSSAPSMAIPALPTSSMSSSPSTAVSSLTVSSLLSSMTSAFSTSATSTLVSSSSSSTLMPSMAASTASSLLPAAPPPPTATSAAAAMSSAPSMATLALPPGSMGSSYTSDESTALSSSSSSTLTSPMVAGTTATPPPIPPAPKPSRRRKRSETDGLVADTTATALPIPPAAIAASSSSSSSSDGKRSRRDTTASVGKKLLGNTPDHQAIFVLLPFTLMTGSGARDSHSSSHSGGGGGDDS
jgi:hypothetical protein